MQRPGFMATMCFRTYVPYNGLDSENAGHPHNAEAEEAPIKKKVRKRSAVSYQPSAPERAAHRIRAERSRLPVEAEC